MVSESTSVVFDIVHIYHVETNMHMQNSMRGSYFNTPDFKVVGIMSHGPLGGGYFSRTGVC